MLDNNTAYKYEIPYKVPFATTQCWTNGTVILQCGTKKVSYNVHHIKPYTSDTNVGDIQC